MAALLRWWWKKLSCSVPSLQKGGLSMDARASHGDAESRRTFSECSNNFTTSHETRGRMMRLLSKLATVNPKQIRCGWNCIHAFLQHSANEISSVALRASIHRCYAALRHLAFLGTENQRENTREGDHARRSGLEAQTLTDVTAELYP